MNTLQQQKAFAAAYGVCPSTNTDSPGCEGSHEFCFFCAFESDPESVGTDCDLYGSMEDLVRSLADQNKDIPTIIQLVDRFYRQTVQPHIEWTNPHTGIHTKSPVWSRDSIRRHLLFSNNFSQLFSAVVRSMFVSLICKQNESLISRETGMVVEDHRKAFLETVEGYRRWVSSMDTFRKKK